MRDIARTASEWAPPACNRVFIVDDHALVRDSVSLVVGAHPKLRLVGGAGDGASALKGIREQQPDIVLMDVSLPDGSGIELTSRILEHWPHIKVLALTMHEDASYLEHALCAGACGFVIKRSAAQVLIQAIETVLTGSLYIDPCLIPTLTKTLIRKQNPSSGIRAGDPDITDRETQVLKLMATGYSNKEIGVQLGISQKTVETYKMRFMKKLDLDSRVDMMRYAVKQGWLQAGHI